MDIIRTEIPEVMIIEPVLLGDNRGWFTEVWSKRKLEALGLDFDFVQDNHSFSAKKGTLRGLHFQLNPRAQTKLVRCTQGAILDVAVDVRASSPTYRKWVSAELSQENKRQLLVPKGFAHGFLTLTDNVEVLYKLDEYYFPEYDSGILWNDPDINVTWGIKNPILSEKDKNAVQLKDSKANFVY